MLEVVAASRQRMIVQRLPQRLLTRSRLSLKVGLTLRQGEGAPLPPGRR